MREKLVASLPFGSPPLGELEGVGRLGGVLHPYSFILHPEKYLVLLGAPPLGGGREG